MAHDAELDRLKAAQDQAFQRKQKVYDAMQVAWQRRSTAHDAMDRAYYDKQIAHKVMNDAWQSYQFVRQHNGPRIDGLNSAQEDAFQNMKQYFDSASNAHEARDGASARYYADQGHYYKQVAQNCVVERRQLVQEVRDARERHEATRPSFEHAKAIFIRAKEEYNRAKEEHLRAQEEFKRAKAAFDEAVTMFKRRLEAFRASAKKVATQGRLEGRWYSKYRSDDGKIHVLLDKNGNPTNKYPHIHVIHDEYGGEVRVVLSADPSRHPKVEKLPGDASGSQVNAAIERMMSELRGY